jgi:rRNA maturation protein Nop10
VQVYFRFSPGGPHNRYRLEVRPSAEPDFCCRRMRHEYGTTVRFASTEEGAAVALRASGLGQNGQTLNGFTDISHCPWCGEAIELAETVE